MSTLKSYFGEIEDGIIELFTLKNDNGVEVKIMNYGATITSIQIPDKDGVKTEIACGFDTLESYFSEAYKANSPYFGGTVGRYCSQIKDAKFTLNGVDYKLAQNAGNNNLHGGIKGFDKKIWSAGPFKENGSVGVSMNLLSKDMEEGFPGNVKVKVNFTLTKDNALKIEYYATTDADTPFTITNHTYFNLTGFSNTVEGHSVQLFSDKKQVWDETGAATGAKTSLAGEPDDLRSAQEIGHVHKAMGGGFEHFYLFEEKGFKLDKVAEIHEPISGRSLEISTSEPGMLLYTGKYTSDALKRENGLQYGKYRGFCCETHRYPNGPNIPNSPKSILKKGENYESTTIFKFNW
ncbi:MAG: aldose epimerase family protein [Draconibacterium sp.]|nr:aldose epimerase family protein [Draconibacterium sp.]